MKKDPWINYTAGGYNPADGLKDGAWRFDPFARIQRWVPVSTRTSDPVDRPLALVGGTVQDGSQRKTKTTRAADCANSQQPARVSSHPTSERREQLMHSVPARTDNALPALSDKAHDAALGRADACPDCCLNVEMPRAVTALTNGFRAGYVCADCGHAWTTDWRD